MPTSVPVPAAEMTQSPEHQAPEPHAATADAAEPAGRAPALIRRARAAARPVSSTAALMTVIALLATGLIGFVLRDLNSIEADINKLETEIDARFVKLETEMDARFAEVDARFDELDAKIDEIALTLAALVAYLRADEGVDAALSGVTGAGSDPAAADPATGP